MLRIEKYASSPLLRQPMKTLSRCAALAAAMAVAFGAGSASAETLRLQGSSGFVTDVMSRYQGEIEKLTGHKLKVTATKSSRGLLALFKGEADLAMVASPLESMITLLRETQPDLPFHLLREFRITRARVAYPVNPANPVRKVSIAQLKKILTGEIDNWQQLGGPDLPIHVVSTRDGGGTKRITEFLVTDGRHIAPHSQIMAESPQEVVEIVAQDPGALGIAQVGLASLRHLPELDTKVAIRRPYILVSLDEPNAAMRTVIAATRRVVFEEEP
jgi:phosphate transport system substrate-binding protein